MAGNYRNPRVRQIRGGRDAEILKPISKIQSTERTEKFSRLNEQKITKRGKTK